MIAILTAMEVTDSSVIAPGGILVTIAGLFALGMNSYKQARGIDLASAREQLAASKERVKEAEGDLQVKLQPMKDEIAGLKQEIKSLRSEWNEDRDRHDAETRTLRAEVLVRDAAIFKFQQYFVDHGLPIPEGLEPL
jgi:predicted  nucleic acid-binding Zn-ribbon protein